MVMSVTYLFSPGLLSVKVMKGANRDLTDSVDGALPPKSVFKLASHCSLWDSVLRCVVIHTENQSLCCWRKRFPVPFLKTWNICSEMQNCREAVRIGWEVRSISLNFSLWFLILLSVKLKPNSFHTRDCKPRKIYSLFTVWLCSRQAFQAIWAV